jgi:signal transduction histidine kinase
LVEQERLGHVGLLGMRERFSALGGHVALDRSTLGGARLEVSLPVHKTVSGLIE